MPAAAWPAPRVEPPQLRRLARVAARRSEVGSRSLRSDRLHQDEHLRTYLHLPSGHDDCDHLNMLARIIVGLAILGVACGPTAGADERHGWSRGAREAATDATATVDPVDSAGHDTVETAYVVPEIDDSVSVTERRDIAFSLPAGETMFFRVHYRDTWAFNGVLNPAEFGLRIDARATDPFVDVAVSFECDGAENGGRADCAFGLANGSSECDWHHDPLGPTNAWGHTALLTMSNMSCNSVTNSSGWFTIRVDREPGPSTSPSVATLRVRNAFDALNDPSVDQDAPR